jgi:hypothetical protein
MPNWHFQTSSFGTSGHAAWLALGLAGLMAFTGMQEQLIKIGSAKAAALDRDEAGVFELGHEADHAALPCPHVACQSLLPPESNNYFARRSEAAWHKRASRPVKCLPISG